MSARPVNLLLVHTHDTGRWLGCYGAPVPTPNFDKFAREGVLFRNAFCAAPGCSSSRASMLTSTWPHENGVMGLVHRGWKLNDPSQHLSNRLKNRGWRTGLIGIQHEVAGPSWRETLGYEDTYVDFPSQHSALRAETARDWLMRKPKEPFFLNVGMFETHRPFPQMESWEEAGYAMPAPWLADDPQTRRDMIELRESISHVDEALGILLHALADAGVAERTLVVYTTDHGLPLPKAKATLYDAGIGVALIMRGPGEFSGGRVFDQMVGHIDFLPTLWDTFGLGVENSFRGVSLVPMLRGETPQAREMIYAQQTYHAAHDPCRCVRTERYKYIRTFCDAPRMILPNCDPGRAKDVVAATGAPGRRRPAVELYDLKYDPNEFENRAGDPGLAAVEMGLAASLEQWMRRMGDPLLKGPVPLAPGGIDTPWSCYDNEKKR